ncbi:hypothetical protein Pla175_22850 [Pirellulimonas nuda]|uniref:Dockerin domain-containing protein n=1 Tax=Pirellulimonas nuda TaxID=2528009 RepID=A0A518DBQ2_9BACT|nr:PEP-CTERM sorting domain-containing protein [Pirellulimonas nuda]QDU88901.1 hypothetical protein Pla175_22850 [Pirellulimonas nuda]
MRIVGTPARLRLVAVVPLCTLSLALISPEANAQAWVDGVGAPSVYNTRIISAFNGGGIDGWGAVRMASGTTNTGTTAPLQNTDGALQNVVPLGGNGETDSYVNKGLGANPITVGDLPGQYDIVQFDLKFDVLPPNDPAVSGSTAPDPRIKGRSFLQSGQNGAPTNGVNFYEVPSGGALPELPLDNNWHTYTIQRDFNSPSWNGTYNNLRIDPVDALPKDAAGIAALLGTVFSIDNVLVGRTTAAEAFPLISPPLTNIVRNGDLSDTSNVVLNGPNNGAFNINGGNGNFGPFRGNTGDVDEWKPYNNNPNSIVEAVANGGVLDIGDDGSYYLDTHWATGAERFSLNSAGGYLNGVVQTDILNGVVIDAAATYEFAFDLNFANRDSNPNSNLKAALTLGANQTDASSAGAVSLFENQLSSLTAGDRQVVSVSGATLQAAKNSGQQVNLILQSLNTTDIPNFPGGTPVPNDQANGQVVSQVQIDNISLVKLFSIPAGDVNKDGSVTQADVALAQLYLDGNGGTPAVDRQNELLNTPAFNLPADVLASLNLNDFDLTGDLFFDAQDVTAIAALVVNLPGDFNGDGFVDAADYTVWRDNLGANESVLPPGTGNGSATVDAGDYTVWKNSFGSPASAGLSASQASVPEPATLGLMLLACAAIAVTRRHSC